MNKWQRIGAALRMGFTWAAGWAAVGFAIEFVHNVWPNALGRMVDIWPAALAGPAFLSGVLFSGLLGIVARGRQFAELSVPGFMVLGGAAGAVVSLWPAIMVVTGLGSIHGPYTVWQVVAPLVVPCVLLGAVSASGSLLLARRAERLELRAGRGLETGGEIGEAGNSPMRGTRDPARTRDVVR